MEEEKFGKEFFNGNKEEPGVYKSYKFEDMYPYFKALAISLKEIFNPSKVLDLGCAKGFLVKAFKDIEVEAYGVDVSEWAISNSPEDVRHLLMKRDLNKDSLPFPNDYFDFITFLGTIEYLTNHRHTVIEIKRVLKNGGGLLLRTIYKRMKRDKLRINIHKKEYWIEEFELNGFTFKPEKIRILKKGILENYFSFEGKKTIKFKLGKFLFKNVVGKNLVLLYDRLIGFKTHTGFLYFVKKD